MTAPRAEIIPLDDGRTMLRLFVGERLVATWCDADRRRLERAAREWEAIR